MFRLSNQGFDASLYDNLAKFTVAFGSTRQNANFLGETRNSRLGRGKSEILDQSYPPPGIAANIGHPYICCGGIAEPSDFGLKTSTIFSIFFARQL